jgi:hypothetical protein
MKRIPFRFTAVFGFSALLADLRSSAYYDRCGSHQSRSASPARIQRRVGLQVEVDCPIRSPPAAILCGSSSCKVQDAQGKIDFKERKIPPQIWRKNKNRAFAWRST